MDGTHPKRKKDKYNPYVLSIENDRCCISFTDGQGQPQKETLYEMLRNEKYNGVYVFSRAASKDELGRRNNHRDKPIEDQIRIPGGMPKIVDDETFARVQSILASRKRHGRRTGKRTYLLTGMVFCGLCGHRYCGDAMQTGGEKNRSVIGTYFCNNRKNHGAHACGNQNIHQQPLEELVLRKIEEIVFDESRIPGIVQAYQLLNQQESGEEGEKIRTLRQNLKTVEQKIANIVNVITNTGSAVQIAVPNGRWCGDQRPLCGPAAGDCQSVEFGFITTV